jgi:hypothetical protein
MDDLPCTDRSMRALRLALLLLALAPSASRAQMHAHEHSPSPLAPADSVRLARELDAVRAATARYRDHANAVRDGYRLFGSESPLMGEHWYRRDLVPLALDLAHPSTLQYATVGGRKVLVGVAYTVYRRPGDALPDGFAGAADHWHTHDIARLADAATADRPLLHWLVQRRIQRGRLGPDGRTLLSMVHAWVWLDNPDGVFAQQQRALPYLRAGLPAAWAAAGDSASAQGVELLVPGACRAEISRTDRLARLGGEQARRLGAACEGTAARLRQSVAGRPGAAVTNAAAAAAWREWTAARARILDPAQLARMQRVMQAAMEHDGMAM